MFFVEIEIIYGPKNESENTAIFVRSTKYVWGSILTGSA